MHFCAYVELYCIVSIHLDSASCSAHQLEALPVRETQREEIQEMYVYIIVCKYTFMYEHAQT